MKFAGFLSAAAIFLGPARGQLPFPPIVQLAPNPGGKSYEPPRDGDWVFTLLPKSLQFHPLFDMTVATKFSGNGRLVRPATPQTPAYYSLKRGGMVHDGEIYGQFHSPSPELLERTLSRALATNGYLPATSPDHTPSLTIVFWWGAEDILRLDEGERPSDPEKKAARRSDRERVFLVSGELDWPSDPNRAEYLRSQATDPLYFVTVSAYDYEQFTQGHPTLLWRTMMTVGSRGVGMKESLPHLIASAGPYFGRMMSEPELTSRKVWRYGHVDLGPIVTVGASPSPLPTAPANGGDVGSPPP